MKFAPMLGSTGLLPERGAWSFEPKLDGWRALVYVSDGVGVVSRRGKDLSESVPEVQGLAAALPAGTVLDGELVVGDGRPAPSTAFRPHGVEADEGAVGVHGLRRPGAVTHRVQCELIIGAHLAHMGARINATQ